MKKQMKNPYLIVIYFAGTVVVLVEEGQPKDTTKFSGR